MFLPVVKFEFLCRHGRVTAIMRGGGRFPRYRVLLRRPYISTDFAIDLPVHIPHDFCEIIEPSIFMMEFSFHLWIQLKKSQEFLQGVNDADVQPGDNTGNETVSAGGL